MREKYRVRYRPGVTRTFVILSLRSKRQYFFLRFVFLVLGARPQRSNIAVIPRREGNLLCCAKFCPRAKWFDVLVCALDDRPSRAASAFMQSWERHRMSLCCMAVLSDQSCTCCILFSFVSMSFVICCCEIKRRAFLIPAGVHMREVSRRIFGGFFMPRINIA